MLLAASFWPKHPPSNNLLSGRDSSGIEHVVSSAIGGRSGAVQPATAKQAQTLHHSARAIIGVDTGSHFYYLRPLANTPDIKKNQIHPDTSKYNQIYSTLFYYIHLYSSIFSQFHPRSSKFKTRREKHEKNTTEIFKSKTSKNFQMFTKCLSNLLQLEPNQQQPRTLHAPPSAFRKHWCFHSDKSMRCGGSTSNADLAWNSGRTVQWKEKSGHVYWMFIIAYYCLFMLIHYGFCMVLYGFVWFCMDFLNICTQVQKYFKIIQNQVEPF